jgi:arylsulfatase A-like enzyme
MFAPASQGSRPNVVLILIDTMRADHLPFHGYERPTAPFLTRLASEGVVFDRAWSTSSWTAPATASLFTSLYPEQHGVTRRVDSATGRVNRVPESAETIAEAFRAAGYHTLGVSDNGLVSPELGFDQGFDVFESAVGATAERVNKWIRDQRPDLASGRPYFLYVHYMEPHEPYLPHEPWFRDFSGDGWRKTPGRALAAAYDSEIRALDEGLARLYRTMGWDDGTIVVVTADHGEEFGDHGGGGHAHSLFSELLRVPLVFHAPHGRFTPRHVSEPVSLLDVLPTLRALIGRPAGPRDEGVSLAGLLRGRDESFDRVLHAHLEQFETGRIWKATLAGEWKRITLDPGLPMLFNLLDDPRERHDLAQEEPAAAAALDEAARELEARLPTPLGPVEASPGAQALQELRALGYVR